MADERFGLHSLTPPRGSRRPRDVAELRGKAVHEILGLEGTTDETSTGGEAEPVAMGAAADAAEAAGLENEPSQEQ